MEELLNEGLVFVDGALIGSLLENRNVGSFVYGIKIRESGRWWSPFIVSLM